jgi:hypothetical protein
VQVTLRAPLAQMSETPLASLVEAAVVVPSLDLDRSIATNARMQQTALRQLYPYVVTAEFIAQRDALFSRDGLTAEGTFALPRVGADLYLALAQDKGDGLRILFPSDVARDDLDWSRCIEQANANLLAKVGTRELPLGMYELPETLSPAAAPWRLAEGGAGNAERILIIGESWLAASCLAHPALPAGAAARLGSSHVMAVLPHRDRLFVFADRGPSHNQRLAEAIWAASADAPQPLPRTLYRLEPFGPRAIG